MVFLSTGRGALQMNLEKSARYLVCIVAVLILAISHVSPAQAQWSSWDCQWSISNFAVVGGTLSARGCRQFYMSTAQWWRVWSDTYTPTSWQIYTRAYGYDRCSNGVTAGGESSSRYDGGGTYGTSGVSPIMTYMTCSGGHTYYVATTNTRWRTSTSSPEGTSGTVAV
jgi:hypothetical protein